MNTCKECKWWDAIGEDDEREYPLHRRCQNPKFVERCPNPYVSDEPDPGDSMIYCYEEGGAFYPGPDFGCIHFEAKQ